MNSDKLYKVQEQDLDRLKEILTVCFQNDPLYSTLIDVCCHIFLSAT
jgi:hypothetical protein